MEFSSAFQQHAFEGITQYLAQKAFKLAMESNERGRGVAFTQQCGKCLGSGVQSFYAKCSHCRGCGQFVSTVQKWIRCSSCNGNGRKFWGKCGNCNGNGGRYRQKEVYQDCTNCGGHGEVICDEYCEECQGYGQYEIYKEVCGKCKGSGTTGLWSKCKKCQGQKYIYYIVSNE